jgi:uncharacterized membrane protein YcaP (DUF421 family)
VGGIVAALVLLVLNYILAEASGVNRRFRKLIQGSPSLLVHNGEVVTAHMAKEHVSMDELNRAFREHGCVDAKDVALAVLEVDGSISVLKNDDIPESVNPHRRLKFLKRH